MNQAVFRLESFSAAALPSPDLLQQEMQDQAYHRGLADGQEMGFSAELRSLSGAIGSLQASLSALDAIRAETTRQAMSDVMPILSEIVSSLAGANATSGLEAALIQEFQRLATEIPPLRWHATCPANAEAMLRRCAQSAGIEEIDIRPGPDDGEISIVLDDGRSAFSNERVVRRFRDLISELQESFR
ncbi:hypothetical protein FNJ84_16180 [Paracoccus sp. M683]|uniref:hypothetical protein n=1 Tax=Paracoccus sp. M683 TaxID=2594268 RepID=UPI00118F070B|nr:hypothetical protein [Paracoccus sp. M683]TRW95516.1 hypothetical protein FNJ84_16180 [Paracoccus sp. M683]